ncbi:hypothetical protein O3G_MSEX006148 [Manduca sexta]|uniref:ZP domain-containing protein n=1 Tax=Manduca sexta TaxID=7130 RepID=A0A921Z2J0_MANSE|nr:hypothetical protein O3G_MSEX006148 [Manduca sexta]
MLRWCAALALCALVVSAADTTSRFQQRKSRSRNANLQSHQQADVDEMVGNLLHWIQGLYQQRSRKARQYFGGKPEKPRPFEPASYLPPVTGYPPAGSRPTPPYIEGTLPSIPSIPTYQPSQPDTSFPSETPYRPSQPDQTFSPSPPSYQPSKPFSPTYQPSQPTVPSYPSQPSQPSQPSYQPSQPSYQPTQSTSPSYQPSQPGYPPSSSYQPPQPGSSFQTPQPGSSFQPSLPGSSFPPSQPGSSFPPSQPGSSFQPSQPGSSYQPSQPGSSYQPTSPSYQPSQPIIPEDTTRPPYVSEGSGSEIVGITQGPSIPDDDEDRHPPHIHAITVDCGKEMMTINIEFNKAYNGIIYSQDHFNEPECVYVRENSNQIKYSFTVSLNTCGTRFFSDFQNEGQAYLENVLVLQNEAGIQEVWDHIRRVRCLWEGNLTKQLVSSLSVGMLNQITSNFSGDTAMARLDIQTGRGPFAPEANGLVKIGETMTLVVSVTGDAGFDIQVKECIARDSGSRHVVPLTDSDGCVLKPKLFGAFQKTRETGNTGASIIAYAFFNAFKFPDEMDLVIQCDVELCKTDCDVCPNPGSLDPKRRRRDVIHIGNRTEEPMTTISKGLKVVFAEDLPEPSGVCLSSSAAIWGSVMVLLGSLMSSIVVSYCWQRSRASVKFS